MNKFSRIRHHIDMKDVRKRHLEESIEIKKEEERIAEEIEAVNAEYQKWKFDWRKDIECNIKEDMRTKDVFTYTLPAAGDDDIDQLQLGARGSDLTYTPYDPAPVNGEFTALTNTDDITNVDDPHNLGNYIRTPVGHSDDSLDFTTGDAVHTGNNVQDTPYVPGDDGGHRGTDISGYYSNHLDDLAYTNTSGATNDDQPDLDQYNGEALRNRVGTYLSFGVVANAIAGFPRYAALKAVDTSEVDTFSLNWFMYGSSMTDNDSESPTYGQKIVNPASVARFGSPGDGVSLFYWAGDKEGAKTYAPQYHAGSSGKRHDGWRPINVSPDGVTDNSYTPWIIPHKPNNDNGTGSYPGQVLIKSRVTLPPWCRGKNTRFILHQGKNQAGVNWANFGVTSARFQRRNVMVVRSTFDDPKGISFVRVGPTSVNQTGEQRKKKVQDMIKASLKYGDMKFGKGMFNSTNVGDK